MKWLTGRRFNQIDLVTACVGGIFFGHDAYMAWLITSLVGVTLSVIAEHWVTTNDRGPL